MNWPITKIESFATLILLREISFYVYVYLFSMYVVLSIAEED